MRRLFLMLGIVAALGAVAAPDQARSASVGAVVLPQTGAPFQVYLDDFSFQGPPPASQPSGKAAHDP